MSMDEKYIKQILEYKMIIFQIIPYIYQKVALIRLDMLALELATSSMMNPIL